MLPARQLYLMQVNEGGGKIDETDPVYPAWKAEQERHRRKQKEPRRVPYKLTDVIWPHEFYAPMLEPFLGGSRADNPFDEVPMAVLLEIQEGLDKHTLPNWFYSTLPLDKLREAIGQESLREDSP